MAATLEYDPLWRMVTAVKTIEWLHDGDAVVAEYAATAQRFVHGDGEDDPLIWYYGSGLTDRRSLQADAQGSIVSTADASGAAITINSYDEYGIPAVGNLGRFEYTGQMYLGQLGMYYYKARMYSPTLGRFMQTDPIGYKDQNNLYAYVGNDPIDGRDPKGLLQCTGDIRCLSVSKEAAMARATVQNAAGSLRDLAHTVRAGGTLTAQQRSIMGAFEKKFGAGSGTSGNLMAAAGLFDRMSDGIGADGAGVKVEFKGNGFAQAGLNSNLITIGSRFFSANDRQGTSQSYIIIHESGHGVGLDDMVLRSDAPATIGGKDVGRMANGQRRAYGNLATDWLGANDPVTARINNESYQCFADSACGD